MGLLVRSGCGGTTLELSLIGGTGDLQALQNLNQLTELNLRECWRLTGQSVSEFVWAQPAPLFIRSWFPIGTLAPISGLVKLKKLELWSCEKLTGTVLMFGHNHHEAPLLLSWGIEPTTALMPIVLLAFGPLG